MEYTGHHKIHKISEVKEYYQDLLQEHRSEYLNVKYEIKHDEILIFEEEIRKGLNEMKTNMCPNTGGLFIELLKWLLTLFQKSCHNSSIKEYKNKKRSKISMVFGWVTVFTTCTAYAKLSKTNLQDGEKYMQFLQN